MKFSKHATSSNAEERPSWRTQENSWLISCLVPILRNQPVSLTLKRTKNSFLVLATTFVKTNLLSFQHSTTLSRGLSPLLHRPLQKHTVAAKCSTFLPLTIQVISTITMTASPHFQRASSLRVNRPIYTGINATSSSSKIWTSRRKSVARVIRGRILYRIHKIIKKTQHFLPYMVHWNIPQLLSPLELSMQTPFRLEMVRHYWGWQTLKTSMNRM